MTKIQLIPRRTDVSQQMLYRHISSWPPSGGPFPNKRIFAGQISSRWVPSDASIAGASTAGAFPAAPSGGHVPQQAHLRRTYLRRAVPPYAFPAITSLADTSPTDTPSQSHHQPQPVRYIPHRIHVPAGGPQ